MIWLLGDNHGNFDYILETVKSSGERPAAVIFLGDLECPLPFSQCVAEIEAAGIQCWAIPGNHDTDSVENYSNLFEDHLFQERNLHGRVAEIDGIRVAGLGGIFRGEIWYPRLTGLEEPAYSSFAEFVQHQNLKRPPRLRTAGENIRNDGVLRKHLSSIFYDDWLGLYVQQADVLVTHEAPDCHPNGFPVISALGSAMRVKFAFHGHQHDSLNYRSHDERLGFEAHGVGFMGITDVYGGRVRVGEFDQMRAYREKT